jgi:hypothetical protein
MVTPVPSRTSEPAQAYQARRMRARSLIAITWSPSMAFHLDRAGYTAEAFRHRYGDRNDSDTEGLPGRLSTRANVA